MAKTYSQLVREIENLQAQAAELKRKEVGDVIARIKEAIGFYRLTPDDLFGTRRGAGRAAKGARGASAGTPRYGDGAGNVWGGRGPRPQWLRDALASGRQLSEFENPAARANGKPPARRSGKKKRGGTVKYRDDAGHSWSGFGPKPGWFKAALAAGKKPEDLAV